MSRIYTLLIAIAAAVVVTGCCGGGNDETPEPAEPFATPPTPTPTPAAPSGGTALTPGTPATGVFTPGLPTDATGKPYVDYTLTVTAPGNYQFDLISSNTSAYDPYIRLLQGTNEIASDDDGGDAPLQSRLTHMLQPGTYTVRVTKFGSTQVSQPTPFTLTVTQAGAAAAATGGRVLSIGSPVAGVFTPGLPTDTSGKPFLDYTLTIPAPGNYTINLISSNTSSYDPYIRLLQGTNEIARDDDGGDAPLQSRLIHMLQPGTYTVRVTKFGSTQVSQPTPFTLTVTPG